MKNGKVSWEWGQKEMPDSVPCERIHELVGECEVLNLPIITNVIEINDSMALLVGTFDVGAFQIRHLILLERGPIHGIDWYAFFTSRGNNQSEIHFDLMESIFTMDLFENEVMGESLFEIERENMRFTKQAPDNFGYCNVKFGVNAELYPTFINRKIFRITLKN